MIQAFFILGKNPTLSFAELVILLKRTGINFTVDEASEEAVVISMEKSSDLPTILEKSGGLIKTGIIIDKVDFEEEENNFYGILSADNLINKYLPPNIRKIHFGISLYNVSKNKKELQSLSDRITELDRLIKENLTNAGKKAGFLKIKDRYLSSVSVFKNRLLDQGTEFVLILTDKGILIGKTTSVQEFESFSFRDYGRPYRDKRSGIMPPKLAKMMINFSGIDNGATILDPFCGSGTILQEAVLSGFRNIIGSDISNKAITDSRKNLDWLFEHYPEFDKLSYNIKFLETDVSEISLKIKNNSIDAIITEPYLGPPLYEKPDIRQIQKIFQSLKSLYIDAFYEFGKILKTGGIIVIVFPCFEIKGRNYFLDIISSVQTAGFKIKNIIPDMLKGLSFIHLTERNTIIYGNKEYLLKREIISFTKK